MTSWSTATRATYLKENPGNFAGPDGSFPIKDGEDVRNAWDLAGHSGDPVATRKKVKEIAARLNLMSDIPGTAKMSQWLGEATEPTAIADFTFDNAVQTGANFIRTGKVFEVGDYPDKAFSLTAEEAKAAIAAFKPVPNKGAHVPTIFDGKMGSLDAVHLADDGRTLVGTVTVPKWLQELHGADIPLKASLEWDRSTKLIVGSTLVPNPRIEDSVLMAAFAQEPTNFASKVDMKTAMQTFHDMSLGAGASCNPSRSDYAYTSSTQKLHDLSAQYGATCHANMSDGTSFLDTMKAMLGILKTPETVNTPPVKAEEKVEMSTTSPTNEELQEQIKALRSENANFASDNRKIKAESLANGLFTSRHLLPTQTALVTAIFERALEADKGGGTVNFADSAGVEKKLSLVEAIKAVFEAAPAHKLTTEASASNPMFTLVDTEGADKDDPNGTKAVRENTTAWAKRMNGQQAVSAVK